MVIWRHYGVSFTGFVTGMAPLVVLGAGLLVALIALAAKAETLDCSCPVGDVTVR